MGELTLFTKIGCEKCAYVKKTVDLKRLGIQEEILGPDNPDSLAHLAWHELVAVAATQLPILVLDYKMVFLMDSFFPEIVLVLLVASILVSTLVLDPIIACSTAILYLKHTRKQE